MADEPDEQATTIKAIWDHSARVYSTRYPGCELRLSPDHYTADEMCHVMHVVTLALSSIHEQRDTP
jgi:hypothetical protein